MKNNNILPFAIFLLVISILGQIWLPWWILMLASALSAILFLSNALKAFSVAFLVIFLEWLVYAYWLNSKNEFIMADKIAQLFKLESALVLMLISSAIAGLAAAFSAASGALLRSLIEGKKQP